MFHDVPFRSGSINREPMNLLRLHFVKVLLIKHRTCRWCGRHDAAAAGVLHDGVDLGGLDIRVPEQPEPTGEEPGGPTRAPWR